MYQGQKPSTSTAAENSRFQGPQRFENESHTETDRTGNTEAVNRSINEGKQTRRRRGDRSKGEVGTNRALLVNAKFKRDKKESEKEVR